MKDDNSIANQRIKEVNSRIIDGVYKVFNVTIVFAIVIIGFRFYNYGYDLFGLFQIILLMIGLFLGLFKNRIHNKAKIWIIISFTYIVLLSGFINLGSLASAKLYYILYPTLLSLYYNFKKAMFYSFLIFLPIAIIAFLYMFNYLEHSINSMEYLNSYSKWTLDLFAMLLMGTMVISVVINYKEALSKNKE